MRLLPFRPLLLLLCFGAGLLALEGGSTSTHRDWRGQTPQTIPDAAMRTAERAARQEVIGGEIARLRQRLERLPDGDAMARLHERLRRVVADYGWVPEQRLVYGIRCIEPMLKGQDRMPAELLEAFVRFDRDLAARGIDLIIMPLVPTPLFASHLLVDGVEAEHEYYPGWTAMMIEMLEAGLEVVDTVNDFRAAAADPVLVSWANDFHTGSRGRQIAASRLAERLQRYDFARELVPHRQQWRYTEQERTGCSWPQRIYVVNGAFRKVRKDQVPPGAPSWPSKGGKVSILAEGASDLATILKNRTFGFLEVDQPQDPSALRRTELVLIGDSQLHSAVYGAGLPEFIMAEVGGVFRWGSKSWSGFSPPEIYREVVPDDAVQPRVVVLSFLPKYFWHSYGRKGEILPSKYTKRALPPLADAPAVAPGGAIDCRVRIGTISDKPTEDPSSLDYDEALMQVAATVLDGPLKGQEIGLRYWILHSGAWTRNDGRVESGQTMQLTISPWQDAIDDNRRLAEHQVFNTTDQDLLIPVYWVTAGEIAPQAVLKR